MLIYRKTINDNEGNVMLREIIKSKGLKQKWIAERIGISESLLAHQIAGRRSVSKLQIRKMAKILHCRQKDLV